MTIWSYIVVKLNCFIVYILDLTRVVIKIICLNEYNNAEMFKANLILSEITSL